MGQETKKTRSEIQTYDIGPFRKSLIALYAIGLCWTLNAMSEIRVGSKGKYIGLQFRTLVT